MAYGVIHEPAEGDLGWLRLGNYIRGSTIPAYPDPEHASILAVDAFSGVPVGHVGAVDDDEVFVIEVVVVIGRHGVSLSARRHSLVDAALGPMSPIFPGTGGIGPLLSDPALAAITRGPAYLLFMFLLLL